MLIPLHSSSSEVGQSLVHDPHYSEITMCNLIGGPWIGFQGQQEPHKLHTVRCQGDISVINGGCSQLLPSD